MDYKIPQDKLFQLGKNILDEIYGPLHPQNDKNRLFDDNGKGRIHIRKNVPYILFKDYQKMSEQMDVGTGLWGQIIQSWMNERYSRKLFDEFAWLTYEL